MLLTRARKNADVRMQQLPLTKWIQQSINFFQMQNKDMLWGKTSKRNDITTGTFAKDQLAAQGGYLCVLSAQTDDWQFSLGRLRLQRQSLPVESE